MYKEEAKYFLVEEFFEEGIYAIYTKKDFGNMSYYVLNEPDRVKENRENILMKFNVQNNNIFFAKQTHSDNIIDIKENDIAKEYDDVDGFISKRKDIVILMQYADCLPIYYYDKKNKVIALVHAGWQGTFKEIQTKVLEKMKKIYNTNIDDVLIALGIGIKSCCYEIKQDFYEKFLDKFDNDLVYESFSQEKGKMYFDLEKFNYGLLVNYGVNPKNIVVSNICTYCSNKFYSYRKEKEKSGRNGAYIFFKKD